MTLTRRLFLPMLPAAAIAAQWDKPAYPEWPPKMVDQILTDSPWTRPLTVALPALRSEVYLTIRWSSALPVRRAVALQQFGRDALESPNAQKVLAPPEEYILEVFGVPATIVHRDLPGFQKELQRSARLLLSSGPETPASEVRVPGIGAFLHAEFRFPRRPEIEGAKTVEFVAAGGGMKIRQPFKLPEMHFGGALAL